MLQLAVEFLAEHRWGRLVDSGWTDWDLRIYCHPLIYLQIKTTQENHGGNKRLIRVHQKMRLRNITVGTAGLGFLIILLLAIREPLTAGVALAAGVSVAVVLWLRATCLARKAAALFDHVAEQLGMTRCNVRKSTASDPVALESTHPTE